MKQWELDEGQVVKLQVVSGEEYWKRTCKFKSPWSCSDKEYDPKFCRKLKRFKPNYCKKFPTFQLVGRIIFSNGKT